jgi:hypothetical protein
MLPLLGAIGAGLFKSSIKKVVGMIGAKTIVGKALTGVGVAGVGYEIGKAAAGGPPNLPALPSVGGTLLPGQFPSMGVLPWWRGAGGKLQFPWQDPNVPQFLKNFALDDAYLKVSYRAPRGYVVVRDPSGKPYALMKYAAKQFGLWHPARKPPISAGDWHKYQTARAVEKRLVKIARHALKKHHRTAAIAATPRFHRKAA